MERVASVHGNEDDLHPIGRVGVIGAGQMGAGIAGTLARANIPTTIVDVNEAILAIGLKRAAEIAAQGVALVPQVLQSSADLNCLAGCNVVIEAVTENEAIKTGIFRSLTGVLGSSAILASNTSTIPISRMAHSWPHPDRFAGMHFFHPAHRMALIEIIRGEQTSDETILALVALARRLGKTPIVVRDCPGFFTTRVLFPYLGQAMQMLQEGTDMDAIDAAATTFGMPTGPIALLDFVGLDTALSISRVMAEGYPDRASVNPLLAELAAMGRLGQKSGAGFRKYEQKKSPGVADPAFEPILQRHRLPGSPSDQAVITDRLFLPMLVEAIRVLYDKVVSDPADIDRGVVLGLAFPASRGGLLAWCDSEGAALILDRLSRSRQLGSWFEPPPLLIKAAQQSGTFLDRAV
jgi:3-hydroxyacyl-CoA dehydrogenase / enoyl-CoA hydratase / 3-hydroxybutyryl-CoA epimerase / enoyl-CoA isomerase